MFRNQYDNDITTFSPQGRLHQVEYAMEAVKQGSACVGIKSATHTVLLAIQRRVGGELASYQKKIIKVDNHIGVVFSGLTSDSRVLSNYMRSEFNMVADKAQFNTQTYGGRPYGVGFLVASHDKSGSHLYEILPSGVAVNYLAHSIGARSQSARTYLESNFPYNECSLSELIFHGLAALRCTLHTDKKMALESIAIAIVGGEDFPVFRSLSSAEIEPYLKTVIDRFATSETTENENSTVADAAADDDAPAPMDIE